MGTSLRYTLCAVFLIVVAVVPTASQIPIQDGPTKNILFIGNSLIGAKNGGLPAYIEAACNASAPTVDFEWDVSLEWGKPLAYHVDNGALDVIRNGSWDIVVLQGFSHDEYSPEEFYAAVRTLNQAIQDIGALPVLFMRWPANPNKLGGLTKYDEQVRKLDEHYTFIGAEIGAPVVPIALMWKELTHNPPTGSYALDYLYGDDVHQSEIAKWVNAYAFYSMFTHRDPTGVSFSMPTVPSDGTMYSPTPAEQARFQEAVWGIIQQREDWAAQQDYLRAEPASLTFAAGAGSQQVTLSTDQRNPSVQPQGDWITATLSGTTITVSVVENTTGTDRTGSVIVSAGTLQRTIAITQERQRLCDFSLSTNSYTFEHTAGSIDVRVSSAEAWDATTTAAWITLQPGDSSVTISVAENPTSALRSDSVVIQGCEREVVYVTQNYQHDYGDSVTTVLEVEAEDYTDMYGFSVDTWPAGFSGEGAISTDSAQAWASYDMSIEKTGQYVISFRYMNGHSKDRPADIYVNGSLVETMPFSPTGGWNDSSWAETATVSAVPLTAGVNTLKVQIVGNRGPILDKLSVGGTAQTPVAPRPIAPRADASSLRLRIVRGNTPMIRYTALAGQRVELTLYSLQGARVATLHSGPAPAGTNSIDPKTAGVHAGLYMVRLVSEGPMLCAPVSIVQ